MSLGLYLHIPFCLSKCHYCNFSSSPIQSEQQLQVYLNNLVREIEIRLKDDIDTIYIGGGTPSLCSAQQLSTIISAVSKQATIKNGAEITLEVNPGTVDKKKLLEFKAIGINRLSIGIQSLNDHFLKLLGRQHSAQQARQIIRFARQIGLDNCSCDLISGLPNQRLEDYQKDLEQMITIAPEHISIYDLTIEKNTTLDHLIESGQLSKPDDELSADMLELTQERLVQAGYEQYELSNYAKPGYFCTHNLKYWTDQEYIGIGCNAHSYLQGRRSWNVDKIDDYNQLLQNEQIALKDQEILEGVKKIGETVIMGLRLTKGIERNRLNEKFSTLWQDQFKLVINKNIDKGLLVMDKHYIYLTKQGRMLANSVFRDFL